MKRGFLWMMLGVVMLFASCQKETVRVSVVATSDLETALFANDYKYSMDARGGCARIASYLRTLKGEIGEQNVVYVDNGDILPGWPINYYMKNEEKSDTTLAAAVMNLLGCEVYGIGEGDIAQGKELLSRHTKSMKGSAVCANLVDAESGELIYKPYAVVERGGMKIAFLGLITEWADKYMSKEDFAGLRVENAEMAAKRWIGEIMKNENPDVVIGLFHMGVSSVSKRTKSREDMAVTIARNVPGFDAIICGHDGIRRSKTVDNISGNKVALASPGRRGLYAVNVTVTAEREKNGFKNKMVDVNIKSIALHEVSQEYNVAMRSRIIDLRQTYNRQITNIKNNVFSADALFGPSAYVDFVHKVQLKNTGADFSFAHPYEFDEFFPEGKFYLSEVNRLCPYDGKLYTIKMTGEEIQKMLRYSVLHFYNIIKTENQLLLKYDEKNNRLKENCKSLESVAGLRYNVNVNKSIRDGKLQILSLANGRAFDPQKEYTVAVAQEYVLKSNLAMNIGAGIKKHEMPERVIAVSQKDLAELALEYLTEEGTIEMKPLNNWRLQPAAWINTIKENEIKKLMNVSNVPEAEVDAEDEPATASK
ncbi:MAG: bifunctional metallophosphatase/5'-nucleotidase [Bacteroidaceae bacterium]|nr:bifunctional metallophosphatase/5'-nucleotidase [Bacteroidaceae bacterium]